MNYILHFIKVHFNYNDHIFPSSYNMSNKNGSGSTSPFPANPF